MFYFSLCVCPCVSGLCVSCYQPPQCSIFARRKALSPGVTPQISTRQPKRCVSRRKYPELERLTVLFQPPCARVCVCVSVCTLTANIIRPTVPCKPLARGTSGPGYINPSARKSSRYVRPCCHAGRGLSEFAPPTSRLCACVCTRETPFFHNLPALSPSNWITAGNTSRTTTRRRNLHTEPLLLLLGSTILFFRAHSLLDGRLFLAFFRRRRRRRRNPKVQRVRAQVPPPRRNPSRTARITSTLR